MTEEMKCEICGSGEHLRTCPLMTGDKFGEETKRPVCSKCIMVWYEYGLTTTETILAKRKLIGGKLK